MDARHSVSLIALINKGQSAEDSGSGVRGMREGQTDPGGGREEKGWGGGGEEVREKHGVGGRTKDVGTKDVVEAGFRSVPLSCISPVSKSQYLTR